MLNTMKSESTSKPTTRTNKSMNSNIIFIDLLSLNFIIRDKIIFVSETNKITIFRNRFLSINTIFSKNRLRNLTSITDTTGNENNITSIRVNNFMFVLTFSVKLINELCSIHDVKPNLYR